MITTSQFKRGSTVEVDGTLYKMEEVNHVKTKKSAVYRVKLRDLRGGHIIERTFNAGDRLATARVETRKMQYLYDDGTNYTFMNSETYDQIEVPAGILGDDIKYLKEGDEVQVVLYGEEALGVELSSAVVLQVTESDPGVKGDTAQGATKPATLETGLITQVPLFVSPGDYIKISTDDGRYLERAKV